MLNLLSLQENLWQAAVRVSNFVDRDFSQLLAKWWSMPGHNEHASNRFGEDSVVGLMVEGSGLRFLGSWLIVDPQALVRAVALIVC